MLYPTGPLTRYRKPMGEVAIPRPARAIANVFCHLCRDAVVNISDTAGLKARLLCILVHIEAICIKKLRKFLQHCFRRVEKSAEDNQERVSKPKDASDTWVVVLDIRRKTHQTPND
jgi:hypothetical protein